jgi:hypothetical protein
MSRRGLAITAVAAIALAAAIAGVGNALVQDDLVLIAQNPRLHDLAAWQGMFTNPFWPPPWSQDLYRPLTSLLLSLEYTLGGGSPLPFRITSYLLSALAALALLRLASRLMPWPVAVGAAALFAAHPVHVEAVALAVAQNELLVGVLAAVVTTWYLDRRRSGTGTLRPRDWALLATLYAAAALLKEQGMLLPLLLIAAEVTLVPPPQPRRGVIAGFTGLAAVAAVLLAVRALVLGDVAGTFTAEALEGVGLGGRAATMLQVVPHWARLLAWPAHLQADYSPQELVASTGLGLAEVAGLAILLAAGSAVRLLRRRAPEISFALLWIGVGFLPVSNLVPTGIVLAERTLFLPSLGFALLVGATAARLVPSSSLSPRALALAGAGAVLVIAGVARSAQRHRTWKDEPTFILQAVNDAPRSYRMQTAFGQLLFDHGRPDEGFVVYERALSLAPPRHAWRVRNDLARRLWEVGADSLALVQVQASATSAPSELEARHYLVLGYLTVGDYAAAGREAERARAEGLAPPLFADLEAVADSAARDGAPPGSVRIRVVRPDAPRP